MLRGSVIINSGAAFLFRSPRVPCRNALVHVSICDDGERITQLAAWEHFRSREEEEEGEEPARDAATQQPQSPAEERSENSIISSPQNAR